MTDLPFGPRIAIIGPSNSGKSTLAHTMSRAWNIPVYHLDQYAHIPNTNWVRRPNDDFAADHHQIISKECWIIDGNYNFLMAERFSSATKVIFLDFFPLSTMCRYLINSFIKVTGHRPGQLQGGSQKISWKLIKYSLFQYPKNRQKYLSLTKDLPQDRVIRIRSLRQLNQLYSSYHLD